MGTLFALLFLAAAIYGAVSFVNVLRKSRRREPGSRSPSAPRASAPPRVPAPAPSLGRAAPSCDAYPELTAEVHARVHEQASATRPAAHADVPDHLPVTVKQWFFSRSERAFYLELVASLRGTGYIVFPNVRLNDLFLISRAAENRQSVLGRLRDKHVDFLILEEGDFKPVLAIELDGASHDTDRQRYRDEVKNTAFRSAGLRLLRFDARRTHSASSLQADLAAHLPVRQVGERGGLAARG